MRKIRLGGLFALALVVAFRSAQPGTTTFHLMKIREFFPGTVLQPNAQYVELQMFASGQNLVQGHSLIVFDSLGNHVATFTFPANVVNGALEAAILIATPEAAALFNIAPDLTMTPVINPRGGKICWDASNVDCVSWGNYSGSNLLTGTPFNVNRSKLPLGQAIRRRTDICGFPTLLDGCDDTNDSQNDFRFATPLPRNNNNALGFPPASTCGNGILEGLEQCDDGNNVSGDGCSASCQIEPVKGDMNEDSLVTQVDIVLMLNCVFLGLGSCDPTYTDVNCSGDLSAADVVLELNKVFLGTAFPC